MGYVNNKLREIEEGLEKLLNGLQLVIMDNIINYKDTGDRKYLMQAAAYTISVAKILENKIGEYALLSTIESMSNRLKEHDFSEIWYNYQDMKKSSKSIKK